MDPKLLQIIDVFKSGTPEKGLRQIGCLIYRSKCVFKLFLLYGLERMGVTFHVEKPSSNSMNWKM